MTKCANLKYLLVQRVLIVIYTRVTTTQSKMLEHFYLPPQIFIVSLFKQRQAAIPNFYHCGLILIILSIYKNVITQCCGRLILLNSLSEIPP